MPKRSLPPASPVQVYLSELSPGSRRTMTFALRTAAAFLGGSDDPEGFPWHRVRVEQMAALRADLASRLAPNTANKIMAAVRGVLRASWRMGRLSAEDLYRCTDVRPVKGGPRERGRSLSRQELKALFAACGDGPGGARDAAALACMYGCRRSEPVAMDLSDYDLGSGRLRVKNAKGSKHRDVYLTNGAKKAMDRWLEYRGDEPGPLLMPVDSVGRTHNRRLHDQALYQLCKRLCAKAGIEPFSPHDLRRTFAGDMLDAGADIALVQQLMGHSSIATTAGYDRRPEAAKQRAAGLVSVPYRWRQASPERAWSRTRAAEREPVGRATSSPLFRLSPPQNGTEGMGDLSDPALVAQRPSYLP